MMTFLISLAVFAIALIGMSVGVILSNRCIKGTCGGLNNLPDSDVSSACEACTTPPEQCDRQRREAALSSSSSTESHSH